ncbi:hypothetical protein KCP77_00450 [Salmonella enterica subsp. enterica]|nr:hypothetical protein KCP77_00450 [Salmonella enterica subsp. enterica]
MVKRIVVMTFALLPLEEECKKYHELPIRHRPDKRSVMTNATTYRAFCW